jgi:hypothetical protein
MEQPRWLDPEGAARYLSVRVDELPRLRKQGKLPEPSRFLGPRKPRYDRLALDALFTGGRSNATQDAADAAVRARSRNTTTIASPTGSRAAKVTALAL